MQRIHDEYLQWRDMKEKEKSEKRRKKNHERIKKREEKKEALKLGEDERTILPKYRDRGKTPPKEFPIHSTPITEQEEDLRRLYNTYMEDLKKKKKSDPYVGMESDQTPGGPHWNVDPHDLSGELYRKYIKKDIVGTPTKKNRQRQPDLYCHDCKKEHWGPCECAICGEPGHDENGCPELENQDIEDPEMPSEYVERHKPKEDKVGITQEKDTTKPPRRTQRIFCTFCEQDGHKERRCPIRAEMLAEKQKEVDVPLSSTMDKEIQDRVEQLRKFGKELDKKKRILQDIGERRPVKEPRLEPRDDVNTGYNRKPVGGKTSTPAQGRGPTKRQTTREDPREPPRRENNIPGGGD